ncbi:MAG TPA: hypothetical protein VIT00_10470 [Terrimicrobiaceae bacterium]
MKPLKSRSLCDSPEVIHRLRVNGVRMLGERGAHGIWIHGRYALIGRQAAAMAGELAQVALLSRGK